MANEDTVLEEAMDNLKEAGQRIILQRHFGMVYAISRRRAAGGDRGRADADGARGGLVGRAAGGIARQDLAPFRAPGGAGASGTVSARVARTRRAPQRMAARRGDRGALPRWRAAPLERGAVGPRGGQGRSARLRHRALWGPRGGAGRGRDGLLEEGNLYENVKLQMGPRRWSRRAASPTRR